MRQNPKVLIIDDEKEICYLLSKILRYKSIDIDCAQTLADARSIINTYAPSLIFLDNNLPDGLGVDFISYIKKNRPETMVVIITGHETDLNRCLEEGAAEIVFKPFTTQKIYSILDQVQ